VRAAIARRRWARPGSSGAQGGAGRPSRNPWASGTFSREERLQLGPRLHALGEQPGVHPAGELAEQFGQRELGLVGDGVLDQRAVELDQVRPEPGHLLQTGVARAGVVQGQQRAAVGEPVAQVQQAAQVADLLVFGQLKDEGGEIAGGEERVRQRRLGEQARDNGRRPAPPARRHSPGRRRRRTTGPGSGR